MENSTKDRRTGLTIYPGRDSNFTDFAQSLLINFYLEKDETIQEGLARASFAWSNGDNYLAQRVYDYASKGWFMFASPVLSNAPAFDYSTKKFIERKGLPISCFLTYVQDSIDGLIEHTAEERWLSVLGGGVGAHWSNVRSVSDKSPGPIPFLHTVDADMEAYRQGKTRRGSYAAYIHVSHPDIIEFLNIRVPTGDTSRKCHSSGFHNAICITDAFMEAVENNDTWDLIDPADDNVRETVSALELWNQILEVRYRTGEPYLYFIDEANRQLPSAQRDKGLQSNGSNLCIEITLPTSKDRTAVCCLSSLNIELYDEWKDTNIVEDLIVVLDNVIEYFINKAPEPLAKAAFSAAQERSLGLGAMGFHYYLQKNNIPFESLKAKSINKKIFSDIKSKAVRSSKNLGLIHGECPDLITEVTFLLDSGRTHVVSSSDYLEGKRVFEYKVGETIFGDSIVEIKGLHSHSGQRNAHLLAIAPNSNSSIILNTSPSIEPSNSNAYVHQTRAGSWPVKNPHLENCLILKNMNTDDVWSEIINSKGSIQHMDIFTDEEKEVYKTAIEINQMWVIEHASDRQVEICQSQSTNLFFPPKMNREEFSKVHRTAWKKKLKSLYYVRTATPHRAENISQKVLANKLQEEIPNEGCVACEG